MSVTAEDLCAFLCDLDAPDRLERPRLLDAGVVEAGVARLAEALGAAFGHRCAVERLPEGGEHYGSITVPGEATSAGAPIVLVVGWYGLIVALKQNHRLPDGFATILLNDDDLSRTEKTVFAAGFAIASPVSALTPRRPVRPYPRLFSAVTAEELVQQIRSLPSDGHPTADLRAWLCATLDVPADGPADERLTSLDVLTLEQVLAEVERIRLCVDVMATLQGSDERRWLVIDDMILDGWTVWAMGAYRNEFGGGLREANHAVHERADILRRTRPHGYAS